MATQIFGLTAFTAVLSFVLAFGVHKALSNLSAGTLADHFESGELRRISGLLLGARATLFPHKPPDVLVGIRLDRYPWGSWLARKISNLRSPDPESGALPLGHSPVGARPRVIPHRPLPTLRAGGPGPGDGRYVRGSGRGWCALASWGHDPRARSTPSARRAPARREPADRVCATVTVSAAPALPACKVADTLTKHRSYGDWHVRCSTRRTDWGARTSRPICARRRTRASTAASTFAVTSSPISRRWPRPRAGPVPGCRCSRRTEATRPRSRRSNTGSASPATRSRQGSARAGHSEHQLGTTVDFRSYGGSAPWNYTDWGRPRPGRG